MPDEETPKDIKEMFKRIVRTVGPEVRAKVEQEKAAGRTTEVINREIVEPVTGAPSMDRLMEIGENDPKIKKPSTA
jgi:hypothetical protein